LILCVNVVDRIQSTILKEAIIDHIRCSGRRINKREMAKQKDRLSMK